MIFSRKAIWITAILQTLCGAVTAQNRTVRQTREEYIERYKSIAVMQMERYGIPASITMAQGILESDCGNSFLSAQSNNHFGIKCKKNWTGGKVYHDDDAKGECFRAYPSVEASYHDHAEFLDTQPRYDSLFAYPSTDYKSWARGLKAAGYATAPDYAQRLVRIIEECRLYLLDLPDGERLYASRSSAEGIASRPTFGPATATPLPHIKRSKHRGQSTTTAGTETLPQTSRPASRYIDPDHYRVTINAHKGYNVYVTNGVHYVLAKENDTFENIGDKFLLSPRNLRKFNDLNSRSEQPRTGEVVYIEPKPKQWRGNARRHICRAGETTYSVSQSYAIRQRSIEKMNRLEHNSTLQAGSELKIK